MCTQGFPWIFTIPPSSPSNYFRLGRRLFWLRTGARPRGVDAASFLWVRVLLSPVRSGACLRWPWADWLGSGIVGGSCGTSGSREITLSSRRATLATSGVSFSMAVCSPSTFSDSVPCCSVWEPSFPSNAATRSTRGFRAEETASLMIELSRWPMRSCCFGPTTGWDVGIPTTWDLSRRTWHGLTTTWDGGLVVRRRLEEGSCKLVELFRLFVALLLQPSWRPEPEGFVEQPLAWRACELSVELLVGSSLLSTTGHTLGLLVDTLSLSETEQSRGLSAEGLSDAVWRSNSRLTGLLGNGSLLSLMGPFSVVLAVDWSDGGWGLNGWSLEPLVDTLSLSGTEQSPGLSAEGLLDAGSRLNWRLTGPWGNGSLLSLMGPFSVFVTVDWSDAGWGLNWWSLELLVDTSSLSGTEQSPGLSAEGLSDAGSHLNSRSTGLWGNGSLLSLMGLFSVVVAVDWSDAGWSLDWWSLELLADTSSLSGTEQSPGLSTDDLSDAGSRLNSRLTGLWGNGSLLSLMGPFSVVVTVDWSDASWGLDWCSLELLVDTSSLSGTEQSPGLSVDGLSGAGWRLNSRLTGLWDSAELFSGPRTEDLSGVVTEDWSGVVTEDFSEVVTEVLSDAVWEPARRSTQLWVGTLPFSRVEQSPGLVTEGLLDAGSGLDWRTMGLLDDSSLLSVVGHPSWLAPEGSIEIGPGTRWCSTGLSLSPELPRVFGRVSTAGTCCGSGSQSSNGDGSSDSMTASYSVTYSSISSCRGVPGDGKTGSSAPRTIRSASSRASGTAPYILACASITRKRRLSSVLQAVQSTSGPSRLMAHSLRPRQPFASSGLNNTEARCLPVRTWACSLSMLSYRPSQRRQWYGARAVGRWHAMWCVFIVLNSEMKRHCVQLYRRPCLFWAPSVARNISPVIDLKGGRWHELVDYPGRKPPHTITSH